MKPKKKDACDSCGAALVQRKDDEEDTVRKRIDVYKGETSPVIDYYRKRKMLTDVDASKRPKEIFNNAVRIIGKPENQAKSGKTSGK
jgi:adenylate kinase